MRPFGKLAFASVGLLAISAPAFAQSADAPASGEADGDDPITVVGTLIRGAQVVGSQTITVDQGAILERGAGTTNELLSTIPQLVGSFNGRFEIDPRGFGTGTNSINKPNLRSIPAVGSGALTLVTMDGMRLTPIGVNDSAVDVDIIPSNVLAGIDAVTDGGSSLYGADAVGGVLNFKTLRRYDGIKLDFNYGFGTKLTSYRTWDGSIMAGTSWSSGNAYISASHYDRSGVMNKEVPWHSSKVYTAANPNGALDRTQCLSAVGSNIKYVYASIPGVFTGWSSNAFFGGARIPIGTPCDTFEDGTYTPETKRTNVFAAVTQDFSDAATLRVTGYWAKRNMYFTHYPLGFTTSDTPAPSAPGAPGDSVTLPGGTGFSFGANAAYVNTKDPVSFETWGVTPELTLKVGSDWQVKTTMHYGRSFNFNRFAQVNSSLLIDPNNPALGYIPTGVIDPQNISKPSSAAAIKDVTDFETATDTKQQLFIARVIADGPLFELPAGEVKAAIGAEYQYNAAQARTTLGRVGAINSLPFVSKSRNAKSIFAEIHIPAASFLDLTASGRFDSYSDFGSTFNPNLGATLKPASWLKIFGHWNTSYNAPTAVDSIGLGSGRLACGQYDVGGPRRPNDPLGKDTSKGGTCALILTGGKPTPPFEPLRPQTAESWAIGFEATPLRGLNFGMEFYSIVANDVIGAVNPADTNTYTTNPEAYIYNVSQNQALYQSYLDQLGNGIAIGQQRNFSAIALIVDSRISNLYKAWIRGVDFHINYEADTKYGNLSFGLNANVPTKAIRRSPAGTTDQLGQFNPLWTATTFVGWKKDRWTAKVTVNIKGPFDNNTTDYLNQRIAVKHFTMTNLFLGYKIEKGDGPLGGTAFRLNVDNLFDREPGRIKLNSTDFPSYTNWTLGRTIKLGITKEF